MRAWRYRCVTSLLPIGQQTTEHDLPLVTKGVVANMVWSRRLDESATYGRNQWKGDCVKGVLSVQKYRGLELCSGHRHHQEQPIDNNR